MKIVDLSHVMNVHTPGWVGYAGNKMYYAQNLQTVRIVAQRIDTAFHVGTHFDGAMHATDNPRGDTCHYPDSRKFAVWKEGNEEVIVKGIETDYFEGEE